MLKILKIILTRSRLSLSAVLLGVSLVLTSCQLLSSHLKQTSSASLTERELVYQKGLALFDNNKFQQSSIFFLKVTQTSLGPHDELYNLALWKLSFIYEKLGEFEKAILALLELEKRKPVSLPLFRVQLALARNYIRLENKDLALKIEKEINQSAPTRTYSLQEVFVALEENSDFNYDHLVIEELQFLGAVQKYYIFVMESSETPLNKNATDLLIHIYDGFFKALAKDTLTYKFKRSLSVELLEQLRKFNLYKLSTNNLNPNTISKFANYSEEKQKFLTDWLHQ